MSAVSIPPGEYAARVTKAQALLRETDLDVLLVNSQRGRLRQRALPLRLLADLRDRRACCRARARASRCCSSARRARPIAQDRSRIPRIHKMVEYRESADPAYPGVDVANFARCLRRSGRAQPAKHRHRGLSGHDAADSGWPEAALSRAPRSCGPTTSWSSCARSRARPRLACLQRGLPHLRAGHRGHPGSRSGPA